MGRRWAPIEVPRGLPMGRGFVGHPRYVPWCACEFACRDSQPQRAKGAMTLGESGRSAPVAGHTRLNGYAQVGHRRGCPRTRASPHQFLLA